jgi:hypothetical protein
MEGVSILSPRNQGKCSEASIMHCGSNRVQSACYALVFGDPDYVPTSPRLFGVLLALLVHTVPAHLQSLILNTSDGMLTCMVA